MSWRDHIKVHPAAELFPAIEDETELRKLGEDIEKNGLQQPIVLWATGDQKNPGEFVVLDGRNRLNAMELVHGSIIDKEFIGNSRYFLDCEFTEEYEFINEGTKSKPDLRPGVDPYAYVMSANMHRRHLTAEQKREVIAAVLKARPSTSDRAVAKAAKVDHKTVGAVRSTMESNGEIPHKEDRTEESGRKARGRKAGTAKPSKPTPPPAAPSPAAFQPAIPVQPKADTTEQTVEDTEREATIDWSLHRTCGEEAADSECSSLEIRWQNSLWWFLKDVSERRAYWDRTFGDWRQFNLPPEYQALIREAAKEWAQLAAVIAVAPEPKVKAVPVSEPEAQARDQAKAKRKRRTKAEIEAAKAKHDDLMQDMTDGMAGDACVLAAMHTDIADAIAADPNASDEQLAKRFEVALRTVAFVRENGAVTCSPATADVAAA